MGYALSTIRKIRVTPNAPIVAVCDFDKASATVDGPTVYGPWAHMCDSCAATFLSNIDLAVRIVGEVTTDRCRDCGEYGETTGHQECQYPRDHDNVGDDQ